MNLNPARLSVKRPVATAMVLLILVLLGGVSFLNLDLDLLPEVNLPIAIVATQYQGAGPEEVENLVTRPIEEAMATVNNVETIQSQSQEGASLVLIEFGWGTDIDDATLDMRERLDQARSLLPADAGEPSVLKFDPNQIPIIVLAVAGAGDVTEMTRLADDVIAPRLERIDGVAAVSVIGGTQREILVEADQLKLQEYRITLDTIAGVLRADNMSLPGGAIEEGMTDLLLRTDGRWTSVEDVRALPVPTPRGPIPLGEVARVTDGVKDVSSFSRLDGQPSVALNVQKATGANTVNVSAEVQRALEELRGELPSGLEVGVVFDQAEFINLSIRSVFTNTLIGALLAVFILWIFLRSFRSTIVIALAIPFSIIATFTLVYFAGLTLNLISLGGLALGVGMMVDNSIVVLENITRRRVLGEEAETAAIEGTGEVGGAITSSTLTTIAVFLPVVFVSGIAAELFGQLSWTISFSLAASLLVAVTLVPLFASRLLKPAGALGVTAKGVREGGEGGEAGETSQGDGAAYTGWFARLRGQYRGIVAWALRHRRVVVATTALVFFGSLSLFPLVGSEFIPAVDQGQILVDIDLPPGSALEASNRVVSQVESIVSAVPEVERVFTTVGSSMESQFVGASSANTGSVQLELLPLAERSRSAEEVAEAIRAEVARIPGTRITVSAAGLTGGGGGGGLMGAPLQVSIRGDDLERLRQLSDEAATRMRRVPGLRDVTTNLEEGRPELRLEVDRQVASQYGLTTAQIAQALRNGVNGQVATRYRTGGDEIDVRLRLEGAGGMEVSSLGAIQVQSPTGAVVPLSQLGRFVIATGPAMITRSDQVRTAVVSANVAGRDLGSVQADVRAALDAMTLPAGYSYEVGGQAEQMADAFGDLGYALALAVLLVYMILAAQFESFLQPMIIMTTVPLSLIGVVLGLVLTGRTLSVAAILGVIMLVGIIVNNAIVLIDYVNQLRRRGMERDEALQVAGATRLRPVLMTALTTILGLLPLAVGIGEGAEIQAPLATVVLAGLVVGTALTLVVVPTIYAIFDDWTGGRRRQEAEEAVPMGSEQPRVAEG